MKEKRKHRYINDFPVIIIIVVAIIAIVLGNLYLSFRPYGKIYRDGYMVLSDNMTYNLVNNASISDDMNIGVTQVSNGDYLYKQVDSYYVGIQEKKEIDIEYPIYSSDGLTIYNMNENIKLVNSDFEIVNGYPGLSLNFGVLYNDGDEEPADDSDYILESLENSVFINTQVMTINTVNNEYTIPINSPIYFGLKYINYYVFDGKKFSYQRIDDIYYDSIIRIGNVRISYEDFLTKLNLIKLKEIDDDVQDKYNNQKEDENNVIDSPIKTPTESKEEFIDFVKPSVSIDSFEANVYSIQSNIKIEDPSEAITSNPTFELYTGDDKLYSRKKIVTPGDFKISGLEADAEYKIIGTYKYKNKNGVIIISTFYEGTIKTNSIDALDEIVVSSELGKRYSNKIEIKNLKIMNPEIETISGIRTIDLIMSKSDSDEQVKYTLPYDKMKELLHGGTVDIVTKNNLKSNTVYEYEFKFYDKNENLLKSSGDIVGIVNTSKASPSINFKSNIDEKTNKVNIEVNTINDDLVIINDYSYELYTLSGVKVYEGQLDYSESTNKLEFSNLDYNKNYVLKISGLYDLEDGNGIQQINEVKKFSTMDLSKRIIAWYNNETKLVTYNSIDVDIYLGSSTVLEREDTVVVVYLADENGDDITNPDGSLKYYYEYTKEQYANKTEFSDYSMKAIFTNLNSNSTYSLKYKIIVQQLEENLVIEDFVLKPTITTESQEAYLKVINKRLAGDILELSFDVIDNDTLIKNNKLIIEIYDGKYDSIKDLNQAKKEKIIKYVYRNSLDILSKNISISLNGYGSDNYTILVYSNHYKDDSGVIKYLSIEGETSDVINLDRNISAYTEMYQQRDTGFKEIIKDKQLAVYRTEINLRLDYGDSLDNIFLVDCSAGICRNLGYIDSSKIYQSIDENSEVENTYMDLKKADYKFCFKNNNESLDHKFYAVITKPGASLKNVKKFNEHSIDNELYVLSKLEYNTGYEIYNISKIEDFFNTGLIKTDGESRHYVVTQDINFYGSNIYQRFKNFNGVIDFQGYSLELYKENTNSYITPFYTINANGVIKNAVLNYHLNYDSIVSYMYGLVYSNKGTINNIIVNIAQLNESGRFSTSGLISYENLGTIEKFAIYLKSDIHTYGTSSIIAYSNSGTIKGGYISPDPNSIDQSKIILHDVGSNNGTFTYNNSGTIENVYNLVSVESAESSFTGGIATIARNVNAGGIVKNTLSVATTTQNSNRTGPSLQTVVGKSINNYYADTDFSHLSYNSKYNKKINVSALRNVGFLEVVLNRDNDFSIIPGYYPSVQMSSFMNKKQLMTSIPYEIKSSKVDILSSEVLNSNINGNDKARIKIYVSNPDNTEIKEIKIANLTTEVLEQSYIETNQISEVIIGAYLSKLDDFAKNEYDIAEILYKNTSGISGSRSYNENDRRSIDIEMYRHITTYQSLIDYIDRNENIYLDSNIELVENVNLNLPNKSGVYSAILDGGKHTINFANNNISRGYFINTLNGTIKNLQIKKLNLNSSNSYIGFIAQSSTSDINNVDISESNIAISGNSGNMYIGFLAARSTGSNVSRISINDCNISRKDNTQVNNNYIGGIKGFSYSADVLSNSYVYNLNLEDNERNVFVNTSAVGGLVGQLEGETSKIISCYSDGTINTHSSNVGGIAGKISYTRVEDSYSDMNINSTGDYIGGIVGKVILSAYLGNGITRNMYVGNINMTNENYHYAAIVPSDEKKVANDNYSLIEDSYTNNVHVIDIDSFSSFDDIDQYKAFDQISNNLPYLKNTSFVPQKIINKEYNPIITNISYEIQYNQECEIPNIRDVNNENRFLTSNLYTYACATSATLVPLEGSNLLINDGKNDDQTLKIIDNEDGTYTLMPIKYLSGYNVKFSKDNKDTEVYLKDLSFYRQISNEEDWKEISSNKNIFENVLLLQNIQFSDEVYSNPGKRIHNLLGNGYSIDGSNTLFNKNLIFESEGQIRDVNFNNINIERSSNYTGIIRRNKGKIINVGFSNITLNAKSVVGIVSDSPGEIDNVNLNTIMVIGTDYVGGLVGIYNDGVYQKPGINNVVADNVIIESKGSYSGGIAGYVQYFIQNIIADHITVNSKGSYSGGIAGYSNFRDITIRNSKVAASGNYVGGVNGYKITWESAKNILVDNLNIEAGGNYVGGIGGYGYRVEDSSVSNTIIAKKQSETEYAYINSNLVGGICGECQGVQNNIVNHVVIYGKNQVGGIVGYEKWDGKHVQNNIVLHSVIKAENLNVGGIVGQLADGYTPYVINNEVIDTSIEGNDRVGGIVGLIHNDDSSTQNLQFYRNSVIASNVISNNNGGGLIGVLYQVPQSTYVLFSNSLFYGNSNSGELVGSILYDDTGSSTGYGNYPITLKEFYKKSTFKEFKNDLNIDVDYQINSVSDVNNVLNNDFYRINISEEGKNYFPILESHYNKLTKDDWVEIPNSISSVSTIALSPQMMMKSMSLRNYSSSYNNKINLTYEVYASDVDKINIDFSDIDSGVSFYYKIGNYESGYIPITSKTYTISYDFKTPIEIYVSNGSNYKTSKITPSDLQKSITLLDDKTYYINNNLLYGEDSVITGNFVNIYKNLVLTSEGKIYNILSKTDESTSIDYSILPNSKSLYSFTYNGQLINTYYTYSVVNSNVKNYQIFVKNGILNIVNNNLNNKKDSYIIDYYNDNEIQIVLNNDGVLYSLKNNIKYPKKFINKNIKEIYTDIYSNSNVVAVKYNNGYVYTFDYRTGEELFNNESKESTSFLEFVKGKLSNNNNSTIENITNYDKYSEIKILKDEIMKTSVEEASYAISNNNSKSSSKTNYIISYNEITKGYDVYDVNQIFDESLDLSSENDKINKNYELVQFYKELSKKQSKNNLNGAIIFALSILTIIFALYLLIKKRKSVEVSS